MKENKPEYVYGLHMHSKNYKKFSALKFHSKVFFTGNGLSKFCRKEIAPDDTSYYTVSYLEVPPNFLDEPIMQYQLNLNDFLGD